MKLDRKEQVLKCIVEEFIKTAQPVGSKTLIENYGLNCSSATIRNTMVELEKAGMIEKTHASSGRVPSAKGYQYYLDHLDNADLSSSIDIQFQKEFQEVLTNKTKSIEDVLSTSCEMLSEMTKMATVVLGPKATEETLVSIQLIKLTDTSAMEIFITDSGYIEKKTFVIEKKNGFTFDTISNAVKLLSDRLTGTRISELENKARSLQPIASKMFGSQGDVILQAFLETLVSFTKKRYKVFGKTNLLSLPEFKDDQEAFIHAVEALEDPNSLEHSLVEKDDLGYVNIGFTHENKGDIAIVSKQINGKDQIAVVGPKRMDYKKILSALEYIVYMLNKHYFSQTTTGSSLIPVSVPEIVEEVPEEIKNVRGGKKSNGRRK